MSSINDITKSTGSTNIAMSTSEDFLATVPWSEVPHEFTTNLAKPADDEKLSADSTVKHGGFYRLSSQSDESVPKFVLNMKLGANDANGSDQTKQSVPVTPVQLVVLTLKFELGKGCTGDRDQCAPPTSAVSRQITNTDGTENDVLETELITVDENNCLASEPIADVTASELVNASPLHRPIPSARRRWFSDVTASPPTIKSTVGYSDALLT